MYCFDCGAELPARDQAHGRCWLCRLSVGLRAQAAAFAEVQRADRGCVVCAADFRSAGVQCDGPSDGRLCHEHRMELSR
jgi:hypothetical protein